MATRKENIKLTISAKDKASKKLSGIQKKIVGIGAAYLGWKAVSGILKDIVQAGIEHEKVWTDVEASLKRHNIAVESTIGSIKRFSDEMQTLSGISDEVIGKATQAFIDYGQDAEGAMDTVRVAMDLAAGGSMDMMAAVDLLAKASVGYTGTLSRYGIIIDESIPKAEKFAAAIEQINEKFGGAAQARAETMAVRMALVSQKFGDLKEELFKLFSPTMLSGIETGISLVSGFINIISEWNKETEEVRTEAGRAVDKFHQWTEQLKNLRIQFQDGTIDLETFRKEMENIGKATGESISPEQIALINEAGEALGMAADATGNWAVQSGFTKEQLIELYDQIEKIKAEKLFKEEVKQAEFFALRMKAVQDSVEEFAYAGDMAIERFTEETTLALTGWEIMWLRKFDQTLIVTKEIEEEKRDIVDDSVDVMLRASNRLADGIVDAVYGTRLDLQAIWNAMARDFITLFVRKIITELAATFAVEMVKILSFLGPHIENDRKIIRQGQLYAQFFRQGVMSEMDGYAFPSMLANTPMSAMAYAGGRSPSAGTQVTVNVNAPITADQFVDWAVHDFAPIIERASEAGQTRIALEPFVQTGDSRGVIT